MAEQAPALTAKAQLKEDADQTKAMIMNRLQELAQSSSTEDASEPPALGVFVSTDLSNNGMITRLLQLS
jgi:hypothetical protein